MWFLVKSFMTFVRFVDRIFLFILGQGASCIHTALALKYGSEALTREEKNTKKKMNDKSEKVTDNINFLINFPSTTLLVVFNLIVLEIA
jgi:hypothetical protein